MKHFGLAGLIIIGISISAAAQTLSLDAFITQALKIHPLIEISVQDYQAKLSELRATQVGEDWNVFVNYSYTKGVASQGFPGFNPDGHVQSANGGLIKRFAKTGTQFEVESRFLSIVGNPGFGSVPIPDLYTLEMDIRLKQPLLRNAFGLMDRYPLVLKDYQSELADLTLSEDLEHFVHHLTQIYLNWQLAHDQLKLIQKQVKKAANQVDVLQKQVKAGSAEKIDQAFAEQNLASKELARSQQQFVVDQLTRQVASSYYGQQPKTRFTFSPSGSYPKTKVQSKSKALSTAIERSRFAEMLEISEAIQVETVKFSQNLTQHDLNIFAEKSFDSAELSAGDAISNFGDNSPLTVGVEFQTRLVGYEEKGQYEAAKARLKQIKASHTDQRRQLADQVTILYRQLDTVKEQIQQVDTLVALADQVATLEREKYEQGRSDSLKPALEAEDRALATRLQYQGLVNQKHHLMNDIQVVTDQYDAKFESARGFIQ